ncbi:MAG: type II secretion system F family protein [Actinomycetia bacterium]|nr:type II secretion system F family protein [Actinomycetes bacterium]MCP4958891.1 type II secretion system F family protein [Actinomycetes bacterium]
MATYAYKVRDKQGQLVEGTIEADNETLVAGRLREMGFALIAIDEQAESALKRDIKIPGFGDKVKLKDLSIFSRQFATMINSGLSLMRALHILGDQTENPALRNVISQIGIDVERGLSLSDAIAKHPKVFDRLYIAMVRAGETGGVLDQVLMQLADTIEKQVALRAKIKSAMTYPVAVLVLVVCILAGMLIFVVPMFESMYSELGGTLPLPTRILLGASGFVTSYVLFIAIGAGIGIFAFKKWKATEAGLAQWDKISLKAPVFGGLLHKTAITRFARTMEALLRAGVPILESLEITSETVGNHVMEVAVVDIQNRVKQGESLAAPMVDHEIFPPMVTQMLAVGEETGAVDTMLDRVGAFYEAEVEATVDALTSLLEPLLIVVLGGTVGGMVVALYMPMFNIVNLIE